jgi:hypothetical protein
MQYAFQNPEILTILLSGLHIYMGGVGIQQFFILVFIFFATQFHRAVLRGQGLDRKTKSNALKLLYTLYAVLVLITVCQIHPGSEGIWMLTRTFLVRCE